MRGFKHGVASLEVDISTRRNSNPTDLCGKQITEIIAVQIQGRDHVKLRRPGQHLLQRNIGNRILDQQFLSPPLVAMTRTNRLHNARYFTFNRFLLRLAHHTVSWLHHSSVFLNAGTRRRPLFTLNILCIVKNPALSLSNYLVTELASRQRIAPPRKSAFSVLHDVALVHKCHTPSSSLKRVLNRSSNQSFCAFLRYWLHPESAAVGESHFLYQSQLVEHLRKSFRLLGPALEIDSGINVLRVLTEYHHIDLLWSLNRAWDSFKVSHGSETRVEIKLLSERDVQRPDAASDRCC
mmetsp:Transcript_7532/g.16010  ORF Transcript_7532/g.16010 Transcript_7532/m.16010 type:complete len:294 (-) Transcript_7532:237-1118(-)